MRSTEKGHLHDIRDDFPTDAVQWARPPSYDVNRRGPAICVRCGKSPVESRLHRVHCQEAIMEKTSIRKVYRRSSAIPVSNRLTVRWSFEGGTAPVIGAPFSATGTVQSAMTYRDGNRIVRGTTIRRLYRDSHGRTRADDMFTAAGSCDSPVSSSITIYDSVAGKQ
jgi:hypothetical protein